MKLIRTLSLCAALVAVTSLASAQSDPATAAVKAQFGMISGVMAKTAEKIPEAMYSFKATPEVRSMDS